MRQFYLHLLTLRSKTTVLVFAVSLATFYAAQAQVYTTTLSGAAEQPPNASPGTGYATVTIVGTNMRVQATFSDLVALTSGGGFSGTTVAHIHAATAVPGAGTAGVATTTPTFPGFPSGVQAGTYDMTFDMTQTSSYNPAYITANGGTTTSAFTALKAAIDAGRSYLNIHSNAFPGGEIRGFLIMCPTINVSIPDAYALPAGVLPNTVYPAYSPAASLTLQANVTGGAGGYTYNWSNGSTAATTIVSPTVATAYTVSVLDQNRCPGMATKTVNVMDISGGKKSDKIVICHKGRNTLTIATPAVNDHIGHGDMLGSCDDQSSFTQRKIGSADEQANELSVRALPNPSRNYFDIQISGNADNAVQVRVYDLVGRVIESRSSLKGNQMLRLGTSYTAGLYLVEIIQGTQKQTLRILKEK